MCGLKFVMFKSLKLVEVQLINVEMIDCSDFVTVSVIIRGHFETIIVFLCWFKTCHVKVVKIGREMRKIRHKDKLEKMISWVNGKLDIMTSWSQ